MNLMPSKRKRNASISTARIKIKFAATSPVHLHIKHAMKTLTPVQDKPLLPSLFQIASHLENFAPANGAKSSSPAQPSGFVELMLHREKLEAALKKAKRENDAFDASRKFSRNFSGQRARNASPKKNDDGGAEKSSRSSLIELKPTEFHLEAPFAESVKLAADFTEWEKYPLNMMRSEDGVWYTTVPLPPGHYSYRFIVDGEWCDDPCSIFRLHENPSGRASAVMEVE
jgi:hypothetical protein